MNNSIVCQDLIDSLFHKCVINTYFINDDAAALCIFEKVFVENLKEA